MNSSKLCLLIKFNILFVTAVTDCFENAIQT